MPLPPPPARHFTPADFGGDDEVQIAEADEFGVKPSRSAAELKERLEISRSKLNGSTDLDMDSKVADTGKSSADADNRFDLNLSKIKSSLDKGVTESNNALASAQEDFNSAMASTIDTGAQAAGNSLAKVNQSLYDSRGRLLDPSNSMMASGKDSLKVSADALKGQFDSAAAAAKDFAESSNKFSQNRIADASKSASQMIDQPLAKFGTLDSAKKDFGNSVDSGIRDLQAEIAAQKRQIEQLRMQAEAAKNGGGGSFGMSTALAPLQPKGSALSPMADSQSFAANAGAASQNSEQSFSPQSALKKATGPLSQLSSEGASSEGSDSGFSPGGALSQLAPIPSSEGGFENGFAKAATDSKPATVYGSLSPETNSGVAPKPNTSTKPVENQFPATPYNGFSGGGVSAQQSNQIQPVGFEAQSGQTNSVVKAGALVPIDGNGSVGRIESFLPEESDSAVNGVDIPAVILTGDGSYAPGSVNRLRR